MSKESIKKWAIAAGVRALKTGAEGVVTLVGANVVNVVSLDWLQILGCVATMMILSICTSLAGLPEVEEGASPLSKEGE